MFTRYCVGKAEQPRDRGAPRIFGEGSYNDHVFKSSISALQLWLAARAKPCIAKPLSPPSFGRRRGHTPARRRCLFWLRTESVSADQAASHRCPPPHLAADLARFGQAPEKR